MAGDWIKIECTLPEKPEVLAMAHQLDLDPDCVVGKLVRIWAWASNNSVDGNVRMTSGQKPDTIRPIDALVRHPGFTAALMDVGWLSEKGGLRFPNWDRHNSKSAKQRALDSLRKHRAREENVRMTSGQKPPHSSLLSSSDDGSSTMEDHPKTEVLGRARAESDEALRLRLEGQYDPAVCEVLEALKPIVRGTDEKRLQHYARLREPKLETARAWLAHYERCRDRVGTVSDMCAYSHPDEVPPEPEPETFEERAKRKSTEEVVRRAEARERERKHR